MTLHADFMGVSSIIDKDIRLTYASLDLELILDEVNQGLGRYLPRATNCIARSSKIRIEQECFVLCSIDPLQLTI